MPKNPHKPLPEFSREAEEAAFWQTHDTTDYVDWGKAAPAQFPDLKPSTKTISLRLPESLLTEIKILAHRRDVPYQSFMKILLAEAVREERG